MISIVDNLCVNHYSGCPGKWSGLAVAGGLKKCWDSFATGRRDAMHFKHHKASDIKHYPNFC